MTKYRRINRFFSTGIPDLTRILIIEPSATLRFGVRKSLGLSHYELWEEPNYDRARSRLSSQSPREEFPDAVVLGWPALSSPGFQALAATLCESHCNRMPLLLLVQENLLLAESCLLKRRALSVQRWRDLEQTPDALRQLLDRAREQGRQEAQPMRILLVDDSATVRARYGALLHHAGYSVTPASSPAEAYDKALRQTFDLAIVDYYMPQESGAQLCKRLKLHPRTRGMDLAVLTGSYDDALVREVLASGASECMFKNESSQLFLARVDAMVRLCEQRRTIHREKAQMDTLLQSIGEGVYGVDADGVLTFVNPVAVKALGYTHAHQLLGRLAHRAIHPLDRGGKPVQPEHCFLHQAYLLGDRLEQWETVFHCGGGSVLQVECSVHPRLVDGVRVGAVVAFRNIAERLLFEEELRWQINHDHLTKLLNRQYLEQALEKEVWRLSRSGESSALLFIDLDRFKQVNDQAGHAAGDRLLVEVSGRLKAQLRQSDVIARVAGDEFAVILYRVNRQQALQLAEKLRQILDRTLFQHADQTFDITGSIGMAMMDGSGRCPEQLLANADAACHVAKRKGRNKIHLFDPSTDAIPFDDQGPGWIRRLQGALHGECFLLRFHPVLEIGRSTGTGRLDGSPEPDSLFEVGVQLRDEKGVVDAEAFMPSAERFNLASEIDRLVITRLAGLLRQTGREEYLFAVSLSRQSLLEKGFPEWLEQLFLEFAVRPERLLLVIREAPGGIDRDALVDQLVLLRERGFGVVLDGHVQGYSSFAHLRQLPASHITIHESLVDGLHCDPVDQAVVAAIVGVAHAQGRATLARGVDSEEAFRLLASLGVDYLQGRYPGQPLQEGDVVVAPRRA